MTLEGTVVKGVVVLDGDPQLPEGVRVRVDFDEEADIGPPPPTETYAEHLASLRQSYAETQASDPGIPLEEAMAQVAAEFMLPLVPRE